MTCRQIDQLLCDYLDGALPFEQQRAFEQHLETCAACTEALTETELALGFVRNAPAVQPPVELIADIIHDTIGVRGTLPVLAPAGGAAEAGLRGWLRPFFNPLLQPRFAMSMVMAVLSLSMLTFYAKGALENWKPGQSKPVAVAEHVAGQFQRAWDATAEFFETVRGMYQLQKELATEPRQRYERARPKAEAPAAAPAEAQPAPGQPDATEPAATEPDSAASPAPPPGAGQTPQTAPSRQPER
jgi:Putative zinc-finger